MERKKLRIMMNMKNSYIQTRYQRFVTGIELQATIFVEMNINIYL